MDTFEITSRLPERLITIGNESFSGCSKMTGSLFMPSELISIGSNAFAGCTGLNGILDFSNSNKLEIISSYAFLGCTSLCGTLSLPDSLKEIGAYAFTKCDFAGPLIIPDNVIIINQYAFALCSSFTGSLIIGSNVEYIGAYAFSECNGFNGQLEITTKVLKEIGNNAFFSCTSLKGTLNLPNTLVSIGNFAFFECKGLENKLVLPQSLVYIGNSAFAYCTGFTQVLEFPKNISYIGRNAFLQCKGFTKIYFDKTSAKSETITIGDKAFGNLKIKCLSNVPPTCKGNTTDDNRCYDSTGFGFVQESSSILAESCELSTAVEMIITLATAIAGSGVLGIVGSFVKEWFDNIYSVAKRITAIFETVIQESIEVFKKNKDANETIEITITEIKNYLSAETENPQFNLSCAKLKGLLEAAFVKEWPSVPYNIKTNVINNSFNDIDFDALMLRHKRERKEKRCACLKRLFSRKRKDDMMLSSESGASEMNLPLI
ncbi:leucine-rich repeat protein [Histomonas meleagridis]|uniref:leucine-rich repeat protein n=1 Tax=Histomonas meleagridis TaxID=135588 RepID=UPI00355AA628|nr:leucine-rich repeat protein [Histomonas meleagridis]KAH0799426.1 leucine-rich repeat protein [Histomonas meleagridis]